MKSISFEQMAKVTGGESSYCVTLKLILVNNCITGGAQAGAQYGFNTGGCTGSFNDFWSFGQRYC